MGKFFRALRRCLRPLELTPLHPQWLALRQRAAVRGWVRAHAHGRLIDVGCGNSPLRRDLEGLAEYVGLDYPPTVALGYCGQAKVFGDAAALPIASGCADVVTLLDVLEHLGEPERAVAEVRRILRPGGVCLIHVPFLYPLHDEPYDYSRWTHHGLARRLSGQGFDEVMCRPTTGPVETASALLAMAIAKSVIDAADRRSLFFFPALLGIPCIPVLNVFGWLFGKCLPADGFMTLSYMVVAKRGDPEGTQGADPAVRRMNSGTCTGDE